MLVEDTTAFIEQLEVQEADRRARKRRRSIARAELEVMRIEFDVQLGAEALRRMEAELAVARELADARGERSLVREMSTVRRRLRARSRGLRATRERLQRLQQQAADDEDARRRAKVFRLHSARHHLECSERRFARLARSQVDLPVLVAKRDGRHWWWYLDRFWWDDEGLSPRDVEALVLHTDLHRQQRGAELARARARILGEEPPPSDGEQAVSPIVRFAVWCRDRGRCVDCRSASDLEYDQIVAFSRGGLRWIANVELRCATCRQRRTENTIRTQISRARIESTVYQRRYVA